MLEQLTDSPYFVASIVLVMLGVILTFAGMVSLIRAQIGPFTTRTLLGLVMLLFGVLAGMIALGMQGYHTLTREEIAAHISVSPIAPQRFVASFKFPDGHKSNYVISGDEIYIDAHILKWQSLANFFGLHTAYELDRVGGRYREIEQERTAERTLHTLGKDKPINLFELRQRHKFLAILFDAKYGSASFVPVTQAAELELRVSTTGLLIREIVATPK